MDAALVRITMLLGLFRLEAHMWELIIVRMDLA